MATKKRNDDCSTEFGLWLRERKAISSDYGFITTNLDYMWMNYKTGYWMYLEEKRYMKEMSLSQRRIFSKMDTLAQNSKDPNYKGFHFLQFEFTGPDDGHTFLNREYISVKELTEFLAFEKSWEDIQKAHKNINITKSFEF